MNSPASSRALWYMSPLNYLHRCHNQWILSTATMHQTARQQGLLQLRAERHNRCQVTQAAQQQHTSRFTTQQFPRFYAPRLPVTIGSSVELAADEARHAVRVLRLKQGDHIELCDGKGGLVACELVHTDKNSASVTTLSEPQLVPWYGPQWVVAAACLTLKGGRTDWLIEKATELGAYAVLPLITERSQTGTTKSKFKAISSKASTGSRQAVHVEDDFQPGRLQRLALAATKQSLRAHTLQLLPAQHLSDLLPSLQRSRISLVATAGAPPVLQVLQQAHQQQQDEGLSAAADKWSVEPCYLLVGPEGDFSAEEVQALADAGVLPVGLGSNRLRTETAALALLAAAVLAADAAAGTP